MRRMALLWLILSAASLPAAAQDIEAARLLAEAREALGVAAQPPLTSLSFSGRLTEDLGGRTASRDLDVYWTVPDKYVHVSVARTGPIAITRREGFNGDAPIFEIISQLPVPEHPSGRALTPEEKIGARRRSALRERRTLALLSLALFAAPPVVYPLQFTYAGLQDVNGTRADAIDAKAADGTTLRLLLDATTHLPLMITWKEKIRVIARTRSTVVMTGSGRVVDSSPPVPASGEAPPGAIVVDPIPGNPAAGLPDVEHQLLLSDYRKANGTLWPHRFREMVEERVFEETQVREFTLNPTISDDRFKVVEK